MACSGTALLLLYIYRFLSLSDKESRCASSNAGKQTGRTFVILLYTCTRCLSSPISTVQPEVLTLNYHSKFKVVKWWQVVVLPCNKAAELLMSQVPLEQNKENFVALACQGWNGLSAKFVKFISPKIYTPPIFLLSSFYSCLPTGDFPSWCIFTSVLVSVEK
jgi:hypothetical protein